jgi:hypothetical protein
MGTRLLAGDDLIIVGHGNMSEHDRSCVQLASYAWSFPATWC